jgi:hypothetical protein
VIVLLSTDFFFFRRSNVPKHDEQRHTVDDLQAATKDERQPGKRQSQRSAGKTGLIEDARPRSTAVTLAAAVRSAGVTTAINRMCGSAQAKPSPNPRRQRAA